MLPFLPILLLAPIRASDIAENENRLEIIVQKYKALGASEISEIRNERYDFRFCVCDSETREPENSNACSCSAVVSGQTTYNSIPQALYSSSCVHSPQYNKCLVARITANATQNVLLVKVAVGSQSLTDPPYQWISNSRFKNKALLSCCRGTACRNYIPCKTGFIQLNYISLSDAPSVNLKQTYLAAVTRSDKPGQWPAKPFKKVSFTEPNMDDFSTIAKIKEYLLQSAKKHHIMPSQFDVAAYKEAQLFEGRSSLVFCWTSRCDAPRPVQPPKLLLRHNVYRNIHGVGELKTNSELEQSAQLWAQHLASGTECLTHDPSKRYGENLFYYATDLLPDEMTLALMTVQSFYLEAHRYDYKTHYHLDYHRTGHFTQLIWKSTSQMGVGVAIRYFDGRRANNCQPNFPSTLIYVVVKYDPPGNVLTKEQYDDNVLPPVQ